MTDDKHSTKHKILGELESIKTLLDDEDAELANEAAAPPDTSTENDVPLLTEALDGVAHDTEGDEENDADHVWFGFDQDDIPVLQATVEENGDPPEDDLPVPALQHGRSAGTGNESTAKSKQENQPGLFDQGPGAPPADADDLQLAPAAPAKPASPGNAVFRAGKAPPRPHDHPLSPKSATENPFLPKHIRDRLHANRANQREMMDSFLNSSHPAQSGSAGKPTAAIMEDKLVEEMLQLFLPRIEAELRERIRAIVRKEQKTNSQAPQD